MYILIILVIIAIGSLTYIGIAIFRQYSLSRNWLDIPNQRSSHDRPIPRGAGLIVAPLCLIGYLLAIQLTGNRFSWGYFLGAILVALVSWIDDLHNISFVWRLPMHLLAAILVLSSEGYWSAFSIGDGSYPLSSVGPAITLLWVVWVINAYNFMDGIDGIAGLQGLTAAAAWALIAVQLENGIFLYSLIIFSSLTAFIFHNWHPAKVFIGDVGSAFLGFTFASMPLMIAREVPTKTDILPIVSILILWPFIFDTVVTLIRRSLRGEMIWQAHRKHLYQLLIISNLSQSTVAILYGVFAVLTSIAAVLLINELVNPIFLVGLVAVISGFFAIAVAGMYQIRSRADETPHEA